MNGSNGSKVLTNSELTAIEATQPVARQLNEKSGPEKPPVSTRKAEANRQNALKSTGPKTFRGRPSVGETRSRTDYSGVPPQASKRSVKIRRNTKIC